MTKRIGVIGLGSIGRPMAAHVAERFECMVWNRTAERSRAFVTEHRATAAGKPADAVKWADVVITCLPTSREVLEIVRATETEWRAGQLLIDATSGDPATSREIATMLGARGVGFVDAPVSGGTSGAVAGTLTVMVGGETEWVQSAEDVIRAFAGRIVHVGPVGAGHAVKAINQMLLAVSIEAAGEGLAALTKLGVSAAVALEVINASSGRSNVTENLIPQRVLTRAWPRTFRLALMDKDVGIALDILRQTGTPHETAETAKRTCETARKALGEEADHVELIKEIERRAGVEIR